MIKNIQKKYWKSIEADIHDHHVWCNLLMDYINILPSTERKTNLTKTKRKDFFYEAFPAKWGQEFVQHDINNNFIIPNQHDINNNFIIPTPKQPHQSWLLPVILLEIKAINGVGLTYPLVALCDSGSTGTLIKDFSL